MLVAAGQLLDDEFIVGHVGVKGVDDPVAVAPGVADGAVAFESAGFAVADQIEPVASPALAVARVGEEFVDQARIGVRRGVAQKSVHLGRGGRHADQVEVDAAREHALGGGRRGVQVFFLEPGEDEGVDGVGDPVRVFDRRGLVRRRLAERPEPGLAFQVRGLGGLERVDPVFDGGEISLGQCFTEGHAGGQLALEDFDQRAGGGVSGEHGLAVLVASANHRFHGLDGEAAGFELCGVALRAIRGEDGTDIPLKIRRSRESQRRNRQQHPVA